MIDKMVHYGLSGIPIFDSKSRLVGIVTEADLISKPAYGGRRRRTLTVIRDLLHGREQQWLSEAKAATAVQMMSTSLATAAPNDTIQAAARLMVEAGAKRLPVIEEERLVGIVSRADVLCAMHRSDEELLAEITSTLHDPLRAPENALIEVTVANGVVTLRGAVSFPIDVPMLSAIVWQFPGVVDVHNELTPQESNPEPVTTHTSDYRERRASLHEADIGVAMGRSRAERGPGSRRPRAPRRPFRPARRTVGCHLRDRACSERQNDA